MKKVTFFLLLMFFSLSIYSQSNMVDGYIINLKGELIQGKLLYKNWIKSPNYIEFKTANELKKYYPTDIKAFGKSNDKYISNNINLDQVKKEVFLQEIIEGSISLYYYGERNGGNYYFVKDNDKLELLEYKESIDGSSYTANKKYLNQLNQYLMSCPSIKGQLKNTKYEKESLKKLFLNYFKCIDEIPTFQINEDKVKLKIGVLAGISNTSLSFQYALDNYVGEYENLLRTTFPTSTSITGGLSLEFIFPRKMKKWSWYNELQFARYETSGKYEDLYEWDNYDRVETKIGLSYINLNNMVRYKHSLGKIKLFGNVGLSNGFGIKSTNYRKTEISYFGAMRTEEDQAIPNMSNHELGLLAGLGIIYNDAISLELRYKRGDGVSQNKSITSLTDSYFLLFGYSF